MSASTIDELIQRLPGLDSSRQSIDDAVEAMVDAVGRGCKVLVCGNGGSAADSEHVVADLMKSFLEERPIPDEQRRRLESMAGKAGEELAEQLRRAIPAVALGANTALMTALANDVAFDVAFAQEVYGLGRKGDVLLAISTTGNSRSVVNAAIVARLLDLKVIVLTGRDGGDLAQLADIAIRVPADRVFEIQELHLPVYHAIAGALERRLFGGRS